MNVLKVLAKLLFLLIASFYVATFNLQIKVIGAYQATLNSKFMYSKV